MVDEDAIRCTECHREVDVFTAIAELWSGGCGELLPFCPECARREFAPDAPASPALSTAVSDNSTRED